MSSTSPRSRGGRPLRCRHRSHNTLAIPFCRDLALPWQALGLALACRRCACGLASWCLPAFAGCQRRCWSCSRRLGRRSFTTAGRACGCRRGLALPRRRSFALALAWWGSLTLAACRRLASILRWGSGGSTGAVTCSSCRSHVLGSSFSRFLITLSAALLPFPPHPLDGLLLGLFELPEYHEVIYAYWLALAEGWHQHIALHLRIFVDDQVCWHKKIVPEHAELGALHALDLEPAEKLAVIILGLVLKFNQGVHGCLCLLKLPGHPQFELVRRVLNEG
mmetsp:Transcript_128912/g.358930  ORF Transcript_128912/g.358930 Transcript_128912/m.358930 type:complete len:278 (+) Transcript_128912:53-886(+)